MKKFIMLVSILILATVGYAQTASEKKSVNFEEVMTVNLKKLDSASSAPTLVSLANSFERIGNAEKNKWEPYYYASYCYAVLAFMTSDKTSIDALADKSELYLQKAEAIDPNNSEITCLFAMINSCRILVDPTSRFQTKGKEVQELIGKAKVQDVNNPRIYLIQARMQLRTPEAFGGGKEVAKKTAETALEKFKGFQAKNNLAPIWGYSQLTSFLERINAQ